MLQRNRHFILFGLSPMEKTMKGIRLLALVYLGSILFSAIVAPFAYWGIIGLQKIQPDTLCGILSHIGLDGYYTNSLNYLIHKGFEDYFDRLRWLPVVATLPWLLVVTRLWSFKNLGIKLTKPELMQFFKWFIYGGLIIALIAWLQYHNSLSSAKADIDLYKIASIIPKALAGGIILSILEEIVFRGLILRIFYTALGPITAVIIGSLFFSYTHFKMPDRIWQEAPIIQSHEGAQADSTDAELTQEPKDLKRVQWWSGFYVAKWTIIGISADFQFLRFINLFLVGVVLSLLTLKRHSLMPSIGLHAGIVFVMLSYRKIFDIRASTTFLGGNQITDGLLPTTLLIGLIFIIMFMPKMKQVPYGQP